VASIGDQRPVVHVTAHYPPYLGGLEKVVEALVAYRMARRLDVTVLTSRDAACAKGPDQDGAGCVQRLRSWEVAHTAIIPGLPARLLRLPPDSLVHLHVAQAFVPEAVYAAHLLRRLPYVAQLHLDVGPSGPTGVLLRAYKPLVLGPVLRAAARVVVFTAEQRAAVSARYRIDPAHMAVIPNGAEETFFYAGQRLPHPKPRLLFVGRFTVQKNLPLLLRALAGVSERFETTLVGDGEAGADLKQLAAGLGLQNVRFYGRADGDELRELYRTADIFVLPSEREGMPLVLLEALAMGLPVVATDIPGIRDVITDGVNGVLVPPHDAAALRTALLSVAADRDGYRRMSETACHLAARYSWAEVGAQFERLYVQVKPADSYR
jgi:glycosyltransferase involved in cell wall biosynthesis